VISHRSMQLAARNLALTLTVAQTGSMSLSCTTTAFVRTTGSFVTDGFAPGMEVLAAGFSTAGNNARWVVTQVTALVLTISGTLTANTAASGRSLTAGMPSQFAAENVELTPVIDKPYVEEQYLPGPAAQITLGPLGEVEVRPMYVLLFYVASNRGMDALNRYADALLTLFAPRTTMSLANGDALYVRTDPAPFRGQLRQSTKPGWAVVPVTIPMRLRTQNSI
jgi:hypothetical protein